MFIQTTAVSFCSSNSLTSCRQLKRAFGHAVLHREELCFYCTFTTGDFWAGLGCLALHSHNMLLQPWTQSALLAPVELPFIFFVWFFESVGFTIVLSLGRLFNNRWCVLSFIQRIKTLVCKDCFLCCTVRAVKLTQCYFWAKCITSCRASHFSPTFGSLRNLQEVVIFLFCYCHASALLYNAWWGVCIVHRASLSLEESYEALKSLKFDSQRSWVICLLSCRHLH